MEEQLAGLKGDIETRKEEPTVPPETVSTPLNPENPVLSREHQAEQEPLSMEGGVSAGDLHGPAYEEDGLDDISSLSKQTKRNSREKEGRIDRDEPGKEKKNRRKKESRGSSASSEGSSYEATAVPADETVVSTPVQSDQMESQMMEGKEIGEDFSRLLQEWGVEVEGLIQTVKTPEEYARLKKGMLIVPLSGGKENRYFIDWKRVRNTLGRKITEQEMRKVQEKNQELALIAGKKFQELVQEDLIVQDAQDGPIRSPWERREVWGELTEKEQRTAVKLYQNRIEHRKKRKEAAKDVQKTEAGGDSSDNALGEKQSSQPPEDSPKKPAFKQYANVEEAVKDARQRLSRAEVLSDAEDVAFKEVSENSDQNPAKFVMRGAAKEEVEDVVTPQVSEEVPFGNITLGESTEIVTDSEHDEQGKHLQLGEDISPHPYQTRTDASYKADLERAQKEINATERAAGGLPPEEEASVSSVAPVPAAEKEPMAPPVSETPTPETKPTDWIMERLFNEIPDGSKFVLHSPTGKTHAEYHREGDAILSSKDGVVTENVLARLNKGWVLEMSTPEAPQQENRDLLKGRDPKDYNEILPGDEWVLRTPKGELLDKLTVNYTLQHGLDIGEIIQTSSTWEKEQSVAEGVEGIPDLPPAGLEWRKKKLQEKLHNEGYVLEVAGEIPKIQPRKPETIDHQKETDPYSRINGGDIWELRSPTGEKLERVYVETVFEKKKRGKKEMVVEVEMEYSKKAQIAKGKKRDQWQNFPLETFRNTLKEKGYVLISRGSGAELDYGGSFDFNEMMKDPVERADPLGLPKKEDERVSYATIEGGEIRVSYDSVAGLYTITRIEDGSIVGSYSEGNIRRLAELEEWEKIGEEQTEPKLQPQESPKQAEKAPERLPLVLPQGDEEFYYRAENGSEFKIRKSAVQEGLYILVALSTLQEREVPEAELQDLAQNNKWERFEKEPEPFVGPEPFNDQLIEKARIAVEEARGDFVRLEAEYKGKADWLKKILPVLKKKDEINPEVRQYWERYENALVALQSLEIEKIKRSGLKDKDLKQSIAGMIREYDFEEAERIDDAKRQLRLKEQKKSFVERMDQRYRNIVKNVDERWPDQQRWKRFVRILMRGELALGQTVAESVMSGARTVGEGYNKLMRTRGGKYTMMAAGGVAFGTALFFSGGAAASMAGFMLAAKRAAAGAGFAVTAEGLANKGAQVLRSRKTNKKAEEFFGKALDGRIEDRLRYGESAVNPDVDQDLLERLETYLKDDVNREAYGKSVKRERNRLYRKTGAVMAGVLFGNSSFVNNIFSEAQAAVPEGSGKGMERVAEVIETRGEGVSLAEKEIGEAAVLLQERTVSAGDTITKYAVDSGKSLGLEGGEGKRFAALLREKLNEKLGSMDPDAAKAAGFVPNKDGVLTADFIRAGEKIDLGKILSAEEMKALAEQAKDNSSVSAVSSVEASVPASQAVLNESAKVLQEAGISQVASPSEVVETIAPATPDAIAEFGVSKQKVTEYLQTLPQAEQVEVFRTMRGTMRDLFNTPEISIYGNYDMNYDLKEHPELSKASMARVLEDHKTLSSRAFYMYDRSLNPLHWTQMQELAKFTEGATKVLGKEIAAPLKRESIEEYVLRMTLIAKESNKSFPGLHMVK